MLSYLMTAFNMAGWLGLAGLRFWERRLFFFFSLSSGFSSSSSSLGTGSWVGSGINVDD